MSLTETRPNVQLPEWLVVQEMDRQRRIAEQAARTHDMFAAELGFERVPVETLAEGDEVRYGCEWWTVAGAQQFVDPPAEWWRVTVFTDVRQQTVEFDAGAFVSRRLDIPEEAF